MRRWKEWMAFASMLAAPAVHAEPAMWVARDKDSTVYFIGTIHLLRPKTQWESPKIHAALKASSELWLEVADFDNQAAVMRGMRNLGVDLHASLTSKLTPEQKAELTKVANEGGMTLASFDQMKPWAAALVVEAIPLMKAGLDAAAGIDATLAREAKENGAAVRGFETLDEQLEILAGGSPEEQLGMLNVALDEAAKGMELFDKIEKFYLEGDLAGIERELVDEMKKDPAAYRKLLVERNIRFSEKVAKILDGSGVQLVAVGAAHMVGPDSLPAQLAKRGIKVERYEETSERSR